MEQFLFQSPHKELTQSTTWSSNCGLQNCERMHFHFKLCCLVYPRKPTNLQYSQSLLRDTSVFTFFQKLSLQIHTYVSFLFPVYIRSISQNCSAFGFIIYLFIIIIEAFSISIQKELLCSSE